MNLEMKSILTGKYSQRQESTESSPTNACNMMMSLFNQCQPIANYKEIKEVILEPPTWIEKVEPLKSRSPTVIKNELADCHSEANHFLVRKRIDRRTVPKTLVCHDYKGGYLQDRYIHSEHDSIEGDGYTFYNWAQIDYFVYFSHHFVTIPPLCWINAGHRNGVKVLGTLITENSEGVKICDEEIFKDMPSMLRFATDLADLTRVFGFDGWLLNIENEVQNPKVLLEFVKVLTELCHNDNSESTIIWYDSVTENGKLSWQDQLNDQNRCYFDLCDGIFLNYGWDEQKLVKTVEEAGHRNFDVFVGIDIFGRNMYGGGQFNTFKAAEMAARYNLSMAFFAPGWTHETIDRSVVGQSFFAEFLNRDYAFWYSLWPYLYTHPVRDYFETDFYIGLDKKCYNLFGQKQQLSKILYPQETNVLINNTEILNSVSESCDCIKQQIINFKNGCVLSKEKLKTHFEFVHHLFACDIEMFGNNLVYFMTKNVNNSSKIVENLPGTVDNSPAKLSVTLLTSLKSGAIRKIKLLSEYKENPVDNTSLLEVNPRSSTILNDSEVRIIYNRFRLKEEDDYEVSVYDFYTHRCNILEIGATIELGTSVTLCGFGIKRLFLPYK